MQYDDSTLPPALRESLRRLFEMIAAKPEDLPAFEKQLFAVLMSVGREISALVFAREGGDGAPFTDAGGVWRRATWSTIHVLTLFGTVAVRRALYRNVRNGPTRSLFSERINLVDNLWTPAAAQIGCMAVAEMPIGRAESFLKMCGVVLASRSSLLRLAAYAHSLWEPDRDANEQIVRAKTTIPPEARTVAVSLDGVMVMMVGSTKQALKAATRSEGRVDKGPAGCREASVGVVAFYDRGGKRIATRRYGRMPEANKAATKSWITAELQHIRKTRPDLATMAMADGAANNWSFLQSLDVDQELVDFFHTAEHLNRQVSKANGASTLDTQAKLKDFRRRLLTVPGAARQVFDDLRALRDVEVHDQPKKKGCGQADYFDIAVDRMDYVGAKAMNRPIGTGVTESTCKLVVCDRLRRTGMRWKERGGQAVMTLRALQINEQFDVAWAELMRLNAGQRDLAA